MFNQIFFKVLSVIVGTLIFLFFLFQIAKEIVDDSPWQLKSFTSNVTYGGTVKVIGKNNYQFTSRTNHFCPAELVRCNKALISYQEYQRPINGKVIVFSFDLRVEQFNFDNPPKWLVIFQDWVRIDPNNKVGNRPISTVEIKSYGKKLFIRHKDSSYQWPSEKENTKQINNGQLQIFLGQKYNIRIELTEGITNLEGGMSLVIDGKIISRARYKTKSETQWMQNVQEFGIYHDRNFAVNRNPNNRVTLSINNLVRSVYYK